MRTGLVVAMIDPLDRYVRQAVEMASGRPVMPRIALLSPRVRMRCILQ